MARRFGKLNKYDSQIRRCSRSGLRYYQSEMVKVGEDRYVHRKFADPEDITRERTPRRNNR